MTDLILGTGALTWNGWERRSDRYGTIYLMQDGATSRDDIVPENQLDMDSVRSGIGLYGRLCAEVIEPRASTHVGDIFRHIYPSTPAAGERIVLGEGTLFIEDRFDQLAIGLRPTLARDADWLDPHQLYRAHEQIVRLSFEIRRAH